MNRLIQLDVIRAIALCLVLGRHMPRSTSADAWTIQCIEHYWGKCGWIGVDLFFVLSGFLVSGLLFHEYKQHGTINVPRFLLRRGLKIYPAFYVFLATITAGLIIRGKDISLRQFCGEFFFLQNYLGGLSQHTWSLAVEEHFYLLLASSFGALLTVRRSNPFRHLELFCGVVAASLLLLRIATSQWLPYTNPTHLFPTHLRIDSLLAGVLIAYWYHLRPERLKFVMQHRRLLLAVSILCVVPSLVYHPFVPFMHTIGLTLLYVGFAGMLMLAICGGPPQSAPGRTVCRWAGYVGTNSYSIYLWHMAVLSVVGRIVASLGGVDYVVLVTCCLGGSAAVGIVMGKCVEMPVLKLRDRWFPSRTSGQGVLEFPGKGSQVVPVIECR